MRRARVFYTGDDGQMLKSGQVVPFVRCTPDFQILTGTNYTRKKTLIVDMWAKFETENMSGIDVLAYLQRFDREIATASSCEMSLYSLSKDSNWVESFLITKASTKNAQNKWSVNFTKAEIGFDLCCADITFRVSATFSRLGKMYTKSIYLNHLGIAESVCTLQNRVQFLEINGGF